MNTHITGSQVKLHSEQDTALRGAVVNANKLNADIGGNADGTRRYRPPQSKKYSQYAETGVQANFERGNLIKNKNGSSTFVPTSNLHLNIGDYK